MTMTSTQALSQCMGAKSAHCTLANELNEHDKFDIGSISRFDSF